jgi:hypothetical protein
MSEPEAINHSLHYGGDTTYECIKVLDKSIALPSTRSIQL